MPIKMNLNIDPYFDDYDVSKKYYRTLFKPGYALQARELTQLQTTLQNQIEQFGANIYKDGTVIRGCNFTEIRDLKYVKVIDGINPVDYLERTEEIDDGEGGTITREYYYELVDNQGLRAIVITAAEGFMSRSPDLNTFFIRYLNTSDAGAKTFASNAGISVQEFYIETLANGEETTYTGNGTEYVVDEDGEGSAYYTVATTQVAPDTFGPVGDSFGLRVDEGAIFQLGHFLYVDEQMIVVSKYIDSDSEIDEPNDRNIGFIVDESIVNSQIDASLLDNATGSPNEQAPGADRLMLVPRLVALDSDEADSDDDFFTLMRYQQGQAVYIRDVSDFNSINEHLARRTYETHGDFVTRPFNFSIERLPWSWDHDANSETANAETEEVSAVVGPGVAYIKGYRVENNGDRSFRVDQIADDEVELAEDQPVSFARGGYYRITAANGHLTNIRSMQTVNLLNTANTVIGSAMIEDITGDRVYFNGIRMSGANTITSVNGFKDGSGATGKIYINTASVGRGFRGLLFPINMFSVKDTSNYRIPVRSFKYNTANSTGGLALSAGAGETLNAISLQNLLVIHANTNQKIVPATANVVSGQLRLTGLGATANVYVYHNATITPTNPVTKTLEEVYVKVVYNSVQRHYSLGMSDVFELVEVIDENGNDFTSSFVMNPRQTYDYYDHSVISVRSLARGSRNPPLVDASDTNVLTVKLKVWRFTPTSNATFFTVDSYGDDADLLKPIYMHKKYWDLRDYMDFRPSRIATAAYANNAGAATTMANNAPWALPAYNVEIFPNTYSHIIPALDTSAYIDYNYYLNRTDVITIDSGGNFTYVKGIADKKSVAPTITGGKSVIAKVYVPGRPMYTPQEAQTLGKPGYAVTIEGADVVEAQTMRDIQNISEQVDRLTYYTTLSMVEQATKDLAITDVDGNNRFKNGIIVDTFSDFMFADVDDPEFDAGLDWSEESLTPATDMRQLSLNVSSVTGISTFGANNDFATLSFNQGPVGVNYETGARIIQQPYSTNWRPVSSTAFSYWGAMALNPDFSNHYNYWTRPGLTTDLRNKQLVKDTPKLQKYVPVTTSARNIKERKNGNITQTDITTIYNTKNNTATKAEIASGYVISEWMRPYMNANTIRVRVWGLRPNTRHYFFFDRAQMSSRCRPAKYVNGKWTGYGKIGTAVKSDKNGRLYAEFFLPANKFMCGSRWLYVLDNDGTWDNAYRSATSRARRQYTAYSYGIGKSGSTPSLRQIENDYNLVSTSSSVSSRTTLPIEQNSNSPMAQTFFIKRAMCGPSECIYLAETHIHFKRKSATNGITLDIREVVNGYPTTEIVPGSRIHKEPSEIRLPHPTTGRPQHTWFTWDQPIRLDAEKEYALVLTADADDPDYLVFTALAGRKRYLTNQYYVQDWGDGNLFASTNGTAWKPFPSEDWHFRLYRYNFNGSSGVVRMKTGDYEFLTLEDSTGQFEESEMVYAKKGAVRKLTCNTASDRITGTGANTTSIAVGDYIYVYNHAANLSTEPQAALMKVDARINSTTISVENPPPWSVTAANSWLVVAGKLQGYDPIEPMNITIENSSARSGNIFAAADTIEGLDSSATGSIGSVDNIVLSYGQLIATKLEDSSNVVKATLTAIDPLSSVAYNQAMSFSDDNYFINKGGVLVKSHSNDLTRVARAQVNFTFTRSFPAGSTGVKTTSTPVLDTDSAVLNAYTYRITPVSSPSSKFITLPVKLTSGFNAEDFRLWITAHRPTGTNIRAFIRLKSNGDSNDISDNPWIQMEMTEGAAYFSPATNRDDFKEFVFDIPASAKDGEDIVTYTNDNGVFTGFSEFAIKIELVAPRVNVVPRLLDLRGVAFE